MSKKNNWQVQTFKIMLDPNLIYLLVVFSSDFVSMIQTNRTQFISDKSHDSREGL